MNNKQFENFSKAYLKQCNKNDDDVINAKTIAEIEKQMTKKGRTRQRTKFDLSKEDKWISSSG